MIGCLAGYVGGGMLGRLLDRALGVVERRVDTIPPAQVVAGTLGAIAGASAARAPRAAGRRCCSRRGRAIPLAGLLVVDHGLARLPHPRQQEREGARDARPVDATARARAGVRRARRAPRRLVGRDGRAAAPARALRHPRLATCSCRASCSTRCRGSATRRTRRAAGARRAAWRRSRRCATKGRCACTCSTTRCPTTSRSTPSSSRSPSGCSSAC